jgi:hypothetical protein
VTAGFRHEVDENCALLGSSGNFTDVSGQPICNILRFHESKSLNPDDGTENCPETSVRNDHYSLRKNPEQSSSLPDNLFVNVYRKLPWFAIRT